MHMEIDNKLSTKIPQTYMERRYYTRAERPSLDHK